MELVLHIGAPKTGTTSLQESLERGRTVLAEHGWHYPRGMDGHRRNHNMLAAHFRAGRCRYIRDWYERERQRAEYRGCDRILLSAEELFRVAGGAGFEEPQRHATPAERVQGLIDALGVTDAWMVAYLRPQPEFAESLYHLAVKRAGGFGGDIESYLPRIDDALDYDTIASAWEAALGSEQIGRAHV